MSQEPRDTQQLAQMVRSALTSRDLPAFGTLLAADVRWGDDDHPRRCRNRSDVLATLERGIVGGMEGRVVELVAGSDHPLRP